MRRWWLMLPLLLACCSPGTPWDNLDTAQRDDLKQWQAVLRTHLLAVLQQKGLRLTPADPSARGAVVDEVELWLSVERSGQISLARIRHGSAHPQADRRLLDMVVEAGPVPPPPASLAIFPTLLAKPRFLVYGAPQAAR